MKNLLEELPQIKWVQISGIGVDYFTHLFPGMMSRDILMTNMRGTASQFLAEWALFGALFYAKKANLFLEK